MQGGSGQALDWTALKPPSNGSKSGWLLAGGLTPDNVGKAVGIAHPTAVDVSSGVCGPDGELSRGLRGWISSQAVGISLVQGVVEAARCVLVFPV